MSLLIRSASALDLSRLAQIDAAAQPCSWTEAQFADSLAAHTVMLFEVSGVVQGFFVTSVVCDEAELLAISVLPAAQRQGFGTHLLQAAKCGAAAQGAQKMFLEVRRSNTAAQHLYLRHGFSQVGERRDYYRGEQDGAGREDALIFICTDLGGENGA